MNHDKSIAAAAMVKTMRQYGMSETNSSGQRRAETDVAAVDARQRSGSSSVGSGGSGWKWTDADASAARAE